MQVRASDNPCLAIQVPYCVDPHPSQYRQLDLDDVKKVKWPSPVRMVALNLDHSIPSEHLYKKKSTLVVGFM